jgi:release factor glutamine methyltransferase
MSQSEPWTIGRLLTWTTDYLKQHGSDSPRLDAEVLLAEARGCKRIDLYTAFAENADEPTRTAFRELVRRRAEGTPVAYLVGKREFFSLSFRVTPDVLIPRPETESLVVRLLDLANAGIVEPRPSGSGEQHGGEIKILDVGSGSGIIAICAAKHLPEARVTAIDSSTAALAVARKNAADHAVADRIEFIESDLLSALPAEQKFNIIASNPPYVSQAEFATLLPSVRNFEPQLALVAGPRGTEVIERLLPQAADHLEPGGWLLIEVSPMIEPVVREMISSHGRFQLAPTIKDSAGHPRIVPAQIKS